MSRYKCLSCGHEFEAKKENPQSLAKPRQCGKCWGYFVVPLEEYQRCKARAEEWIATKPLGIIPLWDVIRGVFAERGLRLSPRKTLRLCEYIYHEIKREKGWKF